MVIGRRRTRKVTQKAPIFENGVGGFDVEIAVDWQWIKPNGCAFAISNVDGCQEPDLLDSPVIDLESWLIDPCAAVSFDDPVFGAAKEGVTAPKKHIRADFNIGCWVAAEKGEWA